MTSSSGSKFIFKNAQNHQINQCLNDGFFPGKLIEGFHSNIWDFCNEDAYLMRISGDSDNFSGSYGLKPSKKGQKCWKSGPTCSNITSEKSEYVFSLLVF